LGRDDLEEATETIQTGSIIMDSNADTTSKMEGKENDSIDDENQENERNNMKGKHYYNKKTHKKKKFNK
jgi:hypothetical protein